MSSKVRYIQMRDAFENPYVFDTKVEKITPKVTYTITWDAFACPSSLPSKTKGGSR